MQTIVKEIEQHNRTEEDKVVATFVLLINKDKYGKYTFDGGMEEGRTEEDKRRTVSALCYLATQMPSVFRLVMNAATVMQDKSRYTIHRRNKNEVS